MAEAVGFGTHSSSETKPFSIRDYKSKSIEKHDLAKSNMLKEDMAKSFDQNPSPIYKEHYINTLAQKGYDKTQLEDYSRSLEMRKAYSKAAELEDMAKSGMNAEQYADQGKDVSFAEKTGLDQIPGFREEDPLPKLTKYVHDYVVNAGTGILENSQKVKEAIDPSLIPDEKNAEGKVVTGAPLESNSKRVSQALLGTGSTILSGASVLSPELAGFITGSDAIKNTANATLPEYQAKQVNDLVNAPMQIVSIVGPTIFGKAEPGSEKDNWFKLGDLVAMAMIAKAPEGIDAVEGAVGNAKAISTLKDISQKASKGEVPHEDVVNINKAAKSVSLNDIKAAAVKDNTPESKIILDKINDVQEKAKSPQDDLHTELAQMQNAHDKLPEGEAKQILAQQIDFKEQEIEQKVKDETAQHLAEAKANGEKGAMVSSLDDRIKQLQDSKENIPANNKTSHDILDNHIKDLEDQRNQLQPRSEEMSQDDIDEMEILNHTKDIGDITKEGELRLNELKAKQDAISINKSKSVDVHSQAENGEGMGIENTEGIKTSKTGSEKEITPEKQAFIDKGLVDLKKSGDYNEGLHDAYVDILGKKHDILNETPVEDEVRNEPEVKAIEQETEPIDIKGVDEQIANIDTALGGGDTEVSEIAPEKAPSKLKGKTPSRFVKAMAHEVSSAYDQVLQHFIRGGKINRAAMDELYGGGEKGSKRVNSEARVKDALLDKKPLSREGQSAIDDLAHKMWEGQSQEGQFETSDFRDAIEQVLNDHNSRNGMVRHINEKFRDLGDMSKEDKAYYDGLDAEQQKFVDEAKDIWNDLSDEDKAFLADESQEGVDKFVDEKSYGAELPKESNEIKKPSLDDIQTDRDAGRVVHLKWPIDKNIPSGQVTPELAGVPKSMWDIAVHYGNNYISGLSGITETEARYYEAVERQRTGKNLLEEGKTKSEKAKALADKIRKGKIGGAQSSIPGLTQAWNGTLELVAKTVEAGGELADAIEKGMDYLRNTDYYKSKGKKGQDTLEAQIKNTIEKNYEKEPTKLTHEAIDIDREKLGLEPIGKTSFDDKKDFAEASKNYKENHISLAQKLVNSRTPATREQAYQIALGIVDLKAKLETAKDDMIKALESKDEKARDNAYADIELTRTQLDTAHQALKNATSEAGRVLRLAQNAIKEDMSLESTIRQMKAYSKDGKITPTEEAKITEITKKLEATQKELDAHQEELAKVKAQKIVDDLAIEENIKAGVEEEVDKINAKLPSKVRIQADKALQAIEKFQKKIRSNNYSSVPVAIIDTALTTIKLAIKAGVKVADAVEMGIDKVKELHGKWEKEEQFRKDMLAGFTENKIDTKERGAIKLSEEGKIKGLTGIVKDLIKKGFTDIESIVKEIKKDVPDMTEHEIRDEISGYGKVSELSNDPINVKLREVKRIGKLITAKEKALANEELLRSGLQRDTPTVKERELQKEINDILRENQMKVEQLPKTDAQWKTLLDRYKTRLQNQIDELQAKADRSDYEIKKRESLQLDAKSLELKRKLQGIKDDRAKAIEKIRLANRNTFEKVADSVIKGLRFAILTGVVTPALKLGIGAGAVRSFIATPLETLATARWSHIPGLRNIAKQAPRYSGEQVAPMAKGIAEWWSKGTAQDIKSAITGKKSEMDVRYGKNDQLAPTLWDIWGQFHKILKTPTKRAEFKTSMEMNLNWEAKQKNELGEYNDVRDPVVQMRAASRALLDSDRAIFMQDNAISTGYKMFLKGLERQMDDGSQGGKIVSKLLQSDMLIVKVPTNFVGESLSYLPGGGAAKALTSIIARSIKGEMNKLTPKQADYISRAISKQAVGLALFGIGYYAYKNMGGNYVGIQSVKDKPKSGEMKIGGMEIPHALQHSVIAQTMQLGATMAWAEEYYKSKGEPSKVDAYTVMAKSLINQNPLIQEANTLTKDLNSTTSKSMWAATLVQKLTTPAKWFAEHFDKDANGNPITRKPQTWKEVLEMNIPGLRQNVTTAWDLIDAERQKQTKLEELNSQIDAEKKKPNHNVEKIHSLRKDIKDIEEQNKQDKLDKFAIDEKGYYDLAKALGKVPHEKQHLSKEEKKVENKLRLPK